MTGKPLRDIVIVLPGITGSVLQKDGRDLWAFSGGAILRALTSLGASLQQLRLGADDPEVDDLGDGVRATRLISDVHLIPGLVKIDGYSALLRSIKDNFEISQGDLISNRPANLFEFPYDWRRHNQVAARALKKLVERHLPIWRKHSGADDAKIVLLAHSMGGLIARHYLEVLEGWRDCRALITFGTPYRGSPNALDYLANGYKQAFVDLTDAMRTFSSVYELLPIYQVVKIDGRYHRVAESRGIPGIDLGRAKSALEFHRAVESAVTAHRKDNAYFTDGYKTIPIVGIRQPTFQSAELRNGKLTVNRDLPPEIDNLLNEGDGTVPRLSAIPIEFSHEYRDTFVSERHSSLQRNQSILTDLLGRIEQMQVKGLRVVRLTHVSKDIAGQPAISLDLDDLYVDGEAVEIRATFVNAKDDATALEASVEPVEGGHGIGRHVFRRAADGWNLTVDGLGPGLYRLEVRATKTGPESPPPVHDLFAVTKR